MTSVLTSSVVWLSQCRHLPWYSLQFFSSALLSGRHPEVLFSSQDICDDFHAHIIKPLLQMDHIKDVLAGHYLQTSPRNAFCNYCHFWKEITFEWYLYVHYKQQHNSKWRLTDNKLTEGGKLCNIFVNINVIEVECVVSFPSIIFMFTKNFKTFHPQSLYCQSSIICNKLYCYTLGYT